VNGSLKECVKEWLRGSLDDIENSVWVNGRMGNEYLYNGWRNGRFNN